MSAALTCTTDARGVATVTLAGPPANALSTGLMTDIHDVARLLGADASLRVVVLTSSVPGMFMAGADLNDVLANLDDVSSLNARLRGAFDAWERLPVPTVASIGGHALGGGCEFALACDFRLMARGRGRIGLPEVARGLLAAGGGTQRMLRLLGRARTMDLVLRGRMLGADDAAAIGLVTEAVEATDLAARTEALVQELLALPAMAVAAAKSVILAGDDLTLADGLTLEGQAMAALVRDSSDAREGVASFLERRPPRFTGR